MDKEIKYKMKNFSENKFLFKNAKINKVTLIWKRLNSTYNFATQFIWSKACREIKYSYLLVLKN